MSSRTQLEERFKIIEEVNDGRAGQLFLAQGTERDRRCLLRLLPAGSLPTYERSAHRLDLFLQCKHRNLSALLEHGVAGRQPFLAYEVVGGQRLSEAIRKKQDSSTAFLPRTTLSLLTPVCQALTAAHAHGPHGALDPRCILIGKTGRTTLMDLGFSWIDLLLERASGAPIENLFIAPEVRANPDRPVAVSDVYSLGMVVMAMLTAAPLGDTHEQASEFIHDVPPQLGALLRRSISTDPEERPQSVEAFLGELSDGIEALRNELRVMSEEHETVGQGTAPHPPMPVPGKGPFDRRGSLSGLLAAAALPPPAAEDPARWLVHRDSFDYGPYTAEEVRERLLQDEIDEHTTVRNLDNGERGVLSEFNQFAEFLADYIPVREDRRRKEAQRRAAVQKTVKRVSAAGVIVIIVGILAAFGGSLYYIEFIRPKPLALPLNATFAQVTSELETPDRAYVGIAADPALIASLLSVEEPEPAPEPPRERRRRRQQHRDDGDLPVDDYDPNEPVSMDFTMGTSGQRLTSSDINATIRTGAGAIRRCFASERSSNPNFASIGTITIRFSVRPDGRPVGVGLNPGSYSQSLERCLVRVFRSLRYPDHAGPSLPVTFPIEVR